LPLILKNNSSLWQSIGNACIYQDMSIIDFGFDDEPNLVATQKICNDELE
jgi:hypothetical protein